MPQQQHKEEKKKNNKNAARTASKAGEQKSFESRPWRKEVGSLLLQVCVRICQGQPTEVETDKNELESSRN